MNNQKKEKSFLFLIILSICISILYVYCRINKWNLEEKMTIFIYPIFALFMGFLMICTILLMISYFIVKAMKTKKMYYSIPSICIMSSLIISSFFFNDQKLREYNFNRYKSEREYIVSLVLNDTLVPDEKGCILVPDEINVEEITRNRKVYIVDTGSASGIYFCNFMGLLETSSGYLYLTNRKWDYYTQDNIILKKQYNKNWYYCATN